MDESQGYIAVLQQYWK